MEKNESLGDLSWRTCQICGFKIRKSDGKCYNNVCSNAITPKLCITCGGLVKVKRIKYCKSCRKEWGLKMKEQEKIRGIYYAEDLFMKYNTTKTEYLENNKLYMGKIRKAHNIVLKNKYKEIYCEICNDILKLELANIDGAYSSCVDDYMWLCRSCHRVYDMCNKTHIGKNPFYIPHIDRSGNYTQFIGQFGQSGWVRLKK